MESMGERQEREREREREVGKGEWLLAVGMVSAMMATAQGKLDFHPNGENEVPPGPVPIPPTP